MKKNLLSWLAMAAMLVGTGCSTDEVVNDFSQENAIQFGTYVGRNAVSRATVINDEKLKTDGFGVFAYYTTNNADFVATGDDASTPNFMYNQEVKVKENETEYSYSPVKYWPNNANDKISFFAYAPYSDGAEGKNFTIINTTAGLPTIQFTVHGTVKEQQDLLWAEPQLNLVKNATPGIDVNDKVKFEFKHALSRIGFEVQTMIDKVNADDVADDDTDNNEDDETKTGDEGGSNTTVSDNGKDLADETTVVVTKVELSGNFITSGTLAWTAGNDNKYTAAITNTEENTGIQSSTTTTTTYTLEAKMGTGEGAELETNFAGETQTHELGAKNNSKVTVYGQSVDETEAQLNADDSYIMIIPKNFEGEDKLTITVYYDVITADEKLESGYSRVSNVISTSFSGVEFEAGKAYKFSLHLGLTSVQLEAEVSEWVDGTNTETDYAVNLPLNIADNDTSTGDTGQ